jgi:hypothetical protein
LILRVDCDTGLRTEWAKSFARAARWEEEVSLLVEEMRRVLWFVRWKREWWNMQGKVRGEEAGIQLKIVNGLMGYAAKQAAMWDDMGMRFASEWFPLLRSNGLPAEWPGEYLDKWEGILIGDEKEDEIDEEDMYIDDDLED